MGLPGWHAAWVCRPWSSDLTVVAYGTSAPELAVSVQAVLEGEASIAVGNVMGSNIANILLILGATAAFRTFKVSLNLLKSDAPIMVMVAAVFILLGLRQRGDGVIDGWEGGALLTALVAYTAFTYRMSRREPVVVEHEYEAAIGLAGSRAFSVVLIGIGIGALVVGGWLIVDGSTGLARVLGIEQTFVGLTIVAVGTSLPELATSIAAVRQNQPDIAIGNIVGSNICNILLVIGTAAMVGPMEIARKTLLTDGPAMLATSVLFLVISRSGQRVTRWEGCGLLVLYAAYLGWTAQRALAG